MQPAEAPSSPPASTPEARPSVPTAAPTTRLVSHLVNGQVYIEEVPVEDAGAASPELPPEAPASGGCAAATSALRAELGGEPRAAAQGAVVHRVVSGARAVEQQCPPGDAERVAAAAAIDALAQQAAAADQRALWEVAAALAPTADRFAFLGTAADRANDGPAALEAWRRAAALAPGNADMARELAEVERRHAVERRFDTIDREHFTARFEGEEKKDLAWESLAILDEAWRSVATALELRPDAPVTVVFYTGAAYEEATGGREWSAGQFDGKIRVRGAAARQGSGALKDLLFHEYVHAALSTSVDGAIPAWFHEGLAQRLEPGLDRARDLAPLSGRSSAELPSLDQLSLGFGRLGNPQEARLYYACALDLVDELARWRGERSFAQLFAAMNAGKSFEAALEATYGLDLGLLEQRWRSRH